MMSKRRLRGVAVLACLALSGCGSVAAVPGDEVHTWNMTVTTGESSTWYQAAERFADALERESDGRMRLRVFTGEQLSAGDPAAGVEQLMSGSKDFSYNSTIIYAGIDPRFGAINAPFLYQDYEDADRAIDNGARAAYEDLCAEYGVKMLGFGESGFRQVSNNVRPVTTPDDLDGIKIRIPGIGLFTDIYRGMGANPTTMNFSEVFTSLQQGTIEGQENPMDVISSSGLAEVQEYLTVWNYVYDPLVLGMNEELFDSLGEADQRIVLDAAEEANAFQVQASRDLEQAEIDRHAGLMDVTRLTDEQVNAFRQAMQPLYDEYEPVWGDTLTTAVKPGS
ncbi:C4-dicarboxylate ABC transporter substrate-binding protein [Prauserella marina]|uniref:C4-dicarboxylate transporter, DctM subunit n=1 Tax=Prauserella marina TaxID=530584 RepID=A0A222VRX9_9PSEU|nr:DctP family TRAP transporter solute-binding subunit [Prauserella marina]ASR36659.1 C4-dicarboxylate ABC transporter substrate-binding protein [Prauserella marina]PWV74079.1 tripartite ATP-independent transporter DctP family solute receptor [Prauserella marina]SDD62499.1 C4-dicarboxylate transporter, DctM subunit [Prauserella marina]